MAQQQTINTPGIFGGLTRFNEEFGSRFTITPSQVMVFIVLVVLFVISMKIFFPITPIA